MSTKTWKDYPDESWNSHSNASCLPDNTKELKKGDIIHFSCYKKDEIQLIISVAKKWYTIREGYYDLLGKMTFNKYRKRRVLVGTPFDIVELSTLES